mmetsp:Transcript_87307/g.247536  ORF Transcript_87307/g.247536 Transcript_87307/m.247536 type:complete len:205 (-) Transcript_87307:55-669(-)
MSASFTERSASSELSMPSMTRLVLTTPRRASISPFRSPMSRKSAMESLNAFIADSGSPLTTCTEASMCKPMASPLVSPASWNSDSASRMACSASSFPSLSGLARCASTAVRSASICPSVSPMSFSIFCAFLASRAARKYSFLAMCVLATVCSAIASFCLSPSSWKRSTASFAVCSAFPLPSVMSSASMITCTIAFSASLFPDDL